MMKKYSVLIMYILVIALHNKLIAQQPPKLTLKQCVETGLSNNLLVQQGGLQAQTEEINWKQAKLNRWPNLNGNLSQGWNQGRSIDPTTNSYINQQVGYSNYGLSSGVILFNGFSLRNNVRQTALNYEASKMEWQQSKDDLTINIILAYLLVLTNEDLLEQSRSQAGLSKKQVERLEVLDKEGAIAPYLLTDLKGQYANDQLNIIGVQNALETAKLSLCRLMNIPYDKNMELEKMNPESFAVKYDNTSQQIYQTALQNFSLVKAVNLRKQSAEKGVLVAKGGLFPTLSFNGNASTNYSTAASRDIFINTTDFTSTDYVTVNNTQYPVVYKVNNYNTEKISYGSQLSNNLFTAFNLNLRIPIFNSNLQRNRIRIAKINLKNNELVATTTKTQLQQSIEQAYINMGSASDRFKTLLDQVAAFTESFRAADIRFNAGVGNSIDYLTAKNNLDRAMLNLIMAKYDFVLRTKVLDYYQGLPLW